MKSVRLVLLIVLGVVVLYAKLTTNGTSGASSSPSASWAESGSQIPSKALHVLQIIRDAGQAPEGYVGGRTFENREGRLPSGGDYREFDVDPHNGPRNAERIIVDWNTKQAWYTGDHYRTFIPMP